MTLVIIFGPPAVGKMTVGLALERLTGFRLFHNHMTVDPVIRLFPFESPAYRRLVQEFRRRIFEEFASSEEPGLIFTFVWAMGDDRDRAFVDSAVETFRMWSGDLFRRARGDTSRTIEAQRHADSSGGEETATRYGRLTRVPVAGGPAVPTEYAG